MDPEPLPAGTVTFLFTDIEGSTRLWERHPEAMRPALVRHDALLRQVIATCGGQVFKAVGDGVCAVFPVATTALSAALAAQRAIGAEPWAEPVTLRVRMALHTGTAELRDGDYYGPTLNRVARLLSAGHGGQVLVSGVTRNLVQDALPEGASLLGRGEHRLKDLDRPERIFQLCHPDLAPPESLPALRTLDTQPSNLPHQVTRFIGRERELAEIRGQLGRARLLTLTGSGGIGKTRLAYQVAADLMDAAAFPDGAWAAELASVTDPALVPQTVAAALGVRETGGEPLLNTLTDWLRDRRLLLVLDNCEHVVDACARVADAIQRGCPNVTVIATSREPLGIAGENIYRVPSLSLPKAGETPTPEGVSRYEAAQLFVERATAARADFALTGANAPALASLCRRLDGIPMAIELAAARARSLSLEDLDHRLDDRFRLLTGGSRTALPRQQTLRALIDWSYDLLETGQKTLLARLSVFRGGWTLEAAETVCAGDGLEEWEVTDFLGALADKSLALTEDEGRGIRFRLLETVRDYARERLAADEETTYRRRHCNYFLALAEAARDRLEGPEQRQWMERLDAEHDNLRTALDVCAAEGEGAGAEAAAAREAGLRIAAALKTFWQVRGFYTEGRERFERVLRSASDAPPALLADALCAGGHLLCHQGDAAAGRGWIERSLALFRAAGDEIGAARALISLSDAARLLDDIPLARTLLEEALPIARAQGSGPDVTRAVYALGALAFRVGDLAGARPILEECLTGAEALGDTLLVANTLHFLGILAAIGGEATLSRSRFEESLAAYRLLGYRQGIANTLHSLGNITLDDRDFAAARALYEEALSLYRDQNNRRSIAFTLGGLGRAAYYQGDDADAERLYGEAEAIFQNLGSLIDTQSISQDRAWVALARSDFASAGAWFAESLRAFREHGHTEKVAYSLEGLAATALAHGDAARCAALFGAAAALRESIGAPLPPNDAERQDEWREQARAALGGVAFWTAWDAGRGLTWQEAAAYALGETAS